MTSEKHRNGLAANRNLALATISFAVAFACWGTIAGLAPLLRQELALSDSQKFLIVAIPVLLGSVGRIPMGILTDRYGGRLVFSCLLIFGFLPPLALAINYSYSHLLFWGLWLGVAGSSFAIGIAFTSKWFTPETQGTALGIYGMGNIGQSVAVFFAPVLAKEIHISGTLLIFGGVSLIWGIIFWLFARNAQTTAKPRTLQENLQVLRSQKLSWVLSLFYSLTFGGFVALSISLPILYNEIFSLTPTRGGALTALFVIAATLSRPIGGWISDHIGGDHLLLFIFGGIFLLGWILALPSLLFFNLGVFACAILLGLGNGGVFKLVPQYFPEHTGTVTGLVGAAGGLGGFFPPIILGIVKDSFGTYTISFILFSLFGLICTLVLNWTFLRTMVRAHGKHQHRE
jgi:NNP family nitrate/nitrite transporter-like MFS transporter